MSRRITAHQFQSVNGVVEHPDRWQFGAFGPEEGRLMGERIAAATDAVIGRKLWQEWSQFWPQAQMPFANWINPVRKHVISSTLSGELGWNSIVIAGDPIAYLWELRASDGGDIVVLGGIETIRSLFIAGLLDEITLTVHPVVANEGRRLFDDSVPITRLHLRNAISTPAGNSIVTYAVRTDEPA